MQKTKLQFMSITCTYHIQCVHIVNLIKIQKIIFQTNCLGKNLMYIHSDQIIKYDITQFNYTIILY